MGFMTTVGILNDRLSQIADHPERFVAELVNAIHSGVTTDHVLGQTTVLRTDHADNVKIILARHNRWENFELSSGMLPKDYDRLDLDLDVLESYAKTHRYLIQLGRAKYAIRDANDTELAHLLEQVLEPRRLTSSGLQGQISDSEWLTLLERETARRKRAASA